MEDFKQYLKEDADDQERDAAKQVMEGLAGIRLENKVAEVAAERRAWLRRRFWSRLLITAALVVIAGVAVLIFRGKENNATEERSTQPGIQPPVASDKLPSINPQATPDQPEKNKEKGPIAQNSGPGNLQSPRFPAPHVRGENSENKAWKALLDQVWYTEYPMLELRSSGAFGKADELLRARDFGQAYIQLQRLERKLPENDTLRLLKGYCLMELGEGSEALTYFEKLESGQPDWRLRLQWYRGLSQLLAGDQGQAIRTFRSIASTPGHPYLEQSKKAIQVLK